MRHVSTVRTAETIPSGHLTHLSSTTSPQRPAAVPLAVEEVGAEEAVEDVPTRVLPQTRPPRSQHQASRHRLAQSPCSEELIRCRKESMPPRMPTRRRHGRKLQTA